MVKEQRDRSSSVDCSPNSAVLLCVKVGTGSDFEVADGDTIRIGRRDRAIIGPGARIVPEHRLMDYINVVLLMKKKYEYR